MKKTGSKLIFSILAAVFALLSFVGFALPYMVIKAGKESEKITRSDWFEGLKEIKEAAKELGTKDNGGIARFAGVLQILAIVALVAVLVLVIVQLFVELKPLGLATMICSIVGIALVALFIVLAIVGGSQLNINNSFAKVSYMPGMGCWLFFVFGLASSVLGLLSSLGKKAAAK